MVADRMSHKYFDDFTPEPELISSWRSNPPDGSIIDCKFDPEWETLLWEKGYAGTVRKGGWRFYKFRFIYVNVDMTRQLLQMRKK
jgi:hypothetical protein